MQNKELKNYTNNSNSLIEAIFFGDNYMIAKKEYIAYYCTLTEYESGWGCRPDGVLVSLTLDTINERIKTINQTTGPEFTRSDHDPKLMIPTDEAVEALMKSPDGLIWCSMSNFRSMRKDS